MSLHEYYLEAGTYLVINTTQRQLHYYQGGKLPRTYPVAVGKPSTPTPAGHYQVINKLFNPGGVLGTRWMGLSISGGNYGIHGTNNPDSIGKAVSNGCIRMYNHHVETIFPEINIGTPVIIVVREEERNGSKEKNGGQTYTIQPGDTLWQIARRYGIPLEVIIRANPHINPDEIYPGQNINISVVQPIGSVLRLPLQQQPCSAGH